MEAERLVMFNRKTTYDDDHNRTTVARCVLPIGTWAHVA